MDSWKAEVRRVRREKIRREKIRRERVRRKKMQMREKVGKSRFTVFFQWFVAPEGRKVGSLKRRVRSQLARWEMKKCTPLWREAHFQVKMYKTHQVRTTFGSWDVEKVHAVVARSTFPSQNVQNTPGPDHFWKLRCRKSARRCGAKHISKSTCTKHTNVGPLFEVAMSKKCTPLIVVRSTFPSQNVQNTPCSDHFWRLRCRLSKKCTPLWRQAHFQVKMYKTHHVRTTFGGSDVDFRKSARRCGAKHISKSKCTKHTILGPLLEVEMSKKCTPLWREAHFEVKMYKTHHVRTTFGGSDVASLNSTTLHYTTLCCTTLHYTTLHYTTLHNTTGYNCNYTTTAHYTPLHSTTLNYTALHSLHYTSLHYTTLHSTTLQIQLHLHNYTPLHSITLHYLTLHYTPQHYN